MIPVFTWSAGNEVPTQLHEMSDSFGWQPVNCVTLTEMARRASVNSLRASAARSDLMRWSGSCL